MASLFTIATKGPDITSAGTILIPNRGDRFDVTGTTPITAVQTNGRGQGSRFYLHFAAAVTLTHGSALALRAAQNYTTAPGDTLAFEVIAANQIRQLVLANNAMPGGGGGGGEGPGLLFGLFDVDAKARLGLQLGDTIANVAPPPDDNLKVLLHFDGVHSSHTISDVQGHTVSANNNCYLSTVERKFGVTSLYVGGGASNYAALNMSEELEIGGSDFTIEAWFRFSSNNIGYQPLLSRPGVTDGQGWLCHLESNNALTFVISANSGWVAAMGTAWIPSVNVWHHIALARQNDNFYVFANGEQVGGGTFSIDMPVTANDIFLGNYPHFPGGNRSLDGYIDEFRLTIGEARYTAAFTPPTAPFPVDPGFKNPAPWKNALETLFEGTTALVQTAVTGTEAVTGLVTAMRSEPGPAPQVVLGEVRTLTAPGTASYNGVPLIPGRAPYVLQGNIRASGIAGDDEVIVEGESIASAGGDLSAESTLLESYSDGDNAIDHNPATYCAIPAGGTYSKYFGYQLDDAKYVHKITLVAENAAPHAATTVNIGVENGDGWDTNGLWHIDLSHPTPAEFILNLECHGVQIRTAPGQSLKLYELRLLSNDDPPDGTLDLTLRYPPSTGPLPTPTGENCEITITTPSATPAPATAAAF